MKYRAFKLVFVFVVSFLIGGCGNSSYNIKDKDNESYSNIEINETNQSSTNINNSTNNENNKTIPSNDEENTSEINQTTISKTKGYLIDSPIEGANYICDGEEGLTDSNGTFECVAPPVIFKIGKLTLGRISEFTDDNKVYPQDLLGLSRDNFSDNNLKLLVRFIQSLDDDGDITDKITIDDSIRETIDIDKDLKDMSEREIEALINRTGKELIAEDVALEHLRENQGLLPNDNSEEYIPNSNTSNSSSDLSIIAKSNSGHIAELKKSIDGKDYVFKVYSNQNPKSEISNDAISIYIYVNDKEHIAISLNSNYANNSKFQIAVFDSNNKQVGVSDIVNYSKNSINAGSINF